MTGDRGYIGTVMSEYLHKRGYTITGLDNEYFYDCDLPELSCGVQATIQADIRDVSGWEDSKPFDAVIHLAGLSNDIMGDLDIESTREINLDATINLAKKAKDAGIPKFLFASSCSVYGSSEKIVDEDSVVNPQTLYARLKYEAEQEISNLADETFSPVFLRNATVYGLSRKMRNDLVVNTMTAKAYTTGNIQVYGDGCLWRPLVHIMDVAKAFRLVLEADRELIHNQVINVGFNHENYTVGRIAGIIKKRLPRTQVEFVDSSDTRNYHVNFDKIHNMFPEFDMPYRDVASEVSRQVEIYKDIEALREEDLTEGYLMGGRFVRIKKLKELQQENKLDRKLRWTNED